MTGATVLHVLMVEPYYGGSHAAFVDVLGRCSRHRITALTLPARKWKWRMRGAAIWFTRDAAEEWMGGAGGRGVDVVLCSDMLGVADFRALWPAGLRDVPIVVYFHENQLTYPLPDEDQRDYQYGMTNITSALAADAAWFNSRFHLEDFVAAAGRLLRKMPDYVPSRAIREIYDKSVVIPPPVLSDLVEPSVRAENQPLTILWCHRWEYDKNPEPFFEALIRLDRAGAAFQLVLLGEQFRTAPSIFADAWDRLRTHIIHTGFVPTRREYAALLTSCDVVVSTAIQENFGVAVVEAILAGCQPLLPNRLAYPELIPAEFHDTCLYAGDLDLFRRLQSLVEGRDRLDAAAMAELREAMEGRFGAPVAIARIDDALEQVVSHHRRLPEHEPRTSYR